MRNPKNKRKTFPNNERIYPHRLCDCAGISGCREKPRILITRLSHIGDCVTSLPLLPAIRSAFPCAMIGWVVEKPSDQFLKNHPLLDYVLPLGRGWMKSPRRLLAIGGELRRMKFDLVLDPQGLTKSSLLGWLSGAPRRIGFASPVGREASLWLHNQRVRPRHSHVVLRTLELLRPLGIAPACIDTQTTELTKGKKKSGLVKTYPSQTVCKSLPHPEIEFQFPHDVNAVQKMNAYTQQAGLGERFAVINPGAGWDSRLWPASRYGEVAAYLAQRHAMPTVVVWAGEREHDWAEKIVAASGNGGHCQIAPPTNLLELAALLHRGSFYIGSDTGPMHIAAAVGTPCITLHGTTRPEDSGAFGSHHLALQRFFQAGTSRQRRRAENNAMQAIQVSDVCQACDEMVGAM